MSFHENPDLQIWNNAAFDNGECKENRRLSSMAKFPVSVKSTTPIKPLQPKNSIVFPKSESNQIVGKRDLGFVDEEDQVRDATKIDSEIEAIQMEINRLSARLESLRLEKMEKNSKTGESNGKIVRAKFMDPKKSGNNLGVLKKNESHPSSGSVKEMNRRGVSLGPSEIMAGPETKSRRLSSITKPPEITPVQSAQSRRKSSFWKLGGIDEGKVTRERGGKSSSVSPKSRRTGMKCAVPKQPFTTSVGSKKHVKKEDGVISSLIQPKKLFNGEKSNPAKKPTRIGRVVASRYSLAPQIQSNGPGCSSALRKRSLPEDGKSVDRNRCEKKRGSLKGKSQESSSSECGEFEGLVSRLKKKWEIPTELPVPFSEDPSLALTNNNSTNKHLPKIKTIRCVNETPRDSGAAKRVADLANKKSFFSDGEFIDDDESMQPSICQALSFADENL